MATVAVGDKRLPCTVVCSLPNGKVLVVREDGWCLEYPPEQVQDR